MSAEFDTPDLEFHEVESLLERCQIGPVSTSGDYRERVLTAGAAAFGRARAIEQMQVAIASMAALLGFLFVGDYYLDHLPPPTPAAGLSARSVFADELAAQSARSTGTTDGSEWTYVEASLASRQFSTAVLVGLYSGKTDWPGGG